MQTDILELRLFRKEPPPDEPDLKPPLCVEYYINGVCLLDMIREIETPFAEQETPPMKPGDYGHNSREYMAEQFRTALTPGDYYYDYGVELYCCYGCGESGCWSVCCKFREDGGFVLMTEFRHNHRNNWQYPISFRFTRENFDAEMQKLGL
ncbi:MAG: hypothetical protein IK130_03880 [Oscillospiraceae bacterium]|nr:hypothetical protein [Oscillospiraceae bacterium]